VVRPAADGPAVLGDDGLPALRLPCLVGGPHVALDDLGSRPVLVNLWASWCDPCREEMPQLQQAHGRYDDQVGFLGADNQDPRPAAVSFLADFGITYAHAVDIDKQLLTELTAPGLPVPLVDDADGRVIDRQIGPVSAARLEELVTGLAATAPTP
jgi:cytochrome c biogenesis protein CcmG/thiol:disulfide interchange protein DsbE